MLHTRAVLHDGTALLHLAGELDLATAPSSTTPPPTYWPPTPGSWTWT